MDFFSILTLIGGLAMFLYGMDLMGKSLTMISGNKLQGILERLTSNKYKSVLLGAGVTAVIQSSSGTTVMVVGLVNSGIMQLRQAIGVIMGANVGTSVTAWILSLTGIRSSNFFINMLKPTSFSPILALIGIAILLFDKSERHVGIANVMIGFALLMFGMEMMSGAMAPLAQYPEFQSFFLKFSNPLLGVLVGMLLTAIIQSSSASIGILQALVITSAIPLSAVIPIIMGQNIGTCITALLATFGAKRNAKRATAVHLIFNILGTVIFMSLFYIGNALLRFSFADQTTTPVLIAAVHTLFNVVNTVVLVNFTGLLEKLTYLILPETEEEKNEKFDEFQTLDDRLLDTPSIALQQTRLKSVEMFEKTKTAIALSFDLLEEYDEEKYKRVRRIEKKIDQYQDRLGSYLLKINSLTFSERDNQTLTIILNSISDIERISDHAKSIAEAANSIHEQNLQFSKWALGELKVYKKAVLDIVNLTLTAYRTDNLNLARKVEPMEEVVDRINNAVKVRHIERLRVGCCSIEIGIFLVDISTSLERISDHCSNISVTMIEIRSGMYDAHKYLKRLHKKDPKFQEQVEYFLKVYQLPEPELSGIKSSETEQMLLPGQA